MVNVISPPAPKKKETKKPVEEEVEYDDEEEEEEQESEEDDDYQDEDEEEDDDDDYDGVDSDEGIAKNMFLTNKQKHPRREPEQPEALLLLKRRARKINSTISDASVA